MLHLATLRNLVTHITSPKSIIPCVIPALLEFVRVTDGTGFLYYWDNLEEVKNIMDTLELNEKGAQEEEPEVIAEGAD